MQKARWLVISALMTLLSAGQVFAQAPSTQMTQFDNDMQVYFRHPNARAMVDELFALPASDLSRPDRIIITGIFFSHLINADRSIGDLLVEKAKTGNSAAKNIAIAALYFLHDPRRVYLTGKVDKKETENGIKSTDVDPLVFPITHQIHLDMMWASFFATGDNRYIDRIAETTEFYLPNDKMRELLPSAKDNPQARKQVMKAAIGNTAVWSLSSNAVHYPEVRNALVMFVQHSHQVMAVAMVTTILAKTNPK